MSWWFLCPVFYGRWVVVGWILGWRTPGTDVPREKLAKAR